MRISDWSSDVCSSDLQVFRYRLRIGEFDVFHMAQIDLMDDLLGINPLNDSPALFADQVEQHRLAIGLQGFGLLARGADDVGIEGSGQPTLGRSEEHTSELQSLMRISYAVFCLKKKQHAHCNTNTKHEDGR